MKRNRREFLGHVGTGMLVAGVGGSLAAELGVSTAFASEGPDAIDFGKLRPLVARIQETPAPKLQETLLKQLKAGETDLKQLTAAAALANAETFGGQDYVGYHVEMALLPALQMTAEQPARRRALPVLKVLYRNAERIQGSGKSKKKTLEPITAAAPEGQSEDALDGKALRGAAGAKALREAVRQADMRRSERIFAAQVKRSGRGAFDQLMWTVEDAANVHRFVLAYRAWGLIDVVGAEHAHTMLRQCVRFCVDEEKGVHDSPIRKELVKNLDKYRLLAREPGTRRPDDKTLAELSQFIFKHNAAQAMDAVGGALADGISPEGIGEALSLAANQLVLTQGRRKDGGWRAHGATPGVHASDAVNAWRNMIHVINPRNVTAGLLVSAYHVGQSKTYEEVDVFPHAEHLAEIKATDAELLLAEAEEAIRQNEQGRAAAAIQIYGQQGHSVRAALDLMLRFAVSEDGRLHAEKYYRTVAEEYRTTREAFRLRHLVALARVTASAYGYDAGDHAGHRAPGYEDACRALGVEA